MEMSDHAPAVKKWLAMATASAEPSSGSVEEPSSSSSTRELRIGEAREAVEVGDVRGKGGEFRLNGLRVADVGQKRGEDRKAGGRGGNRQAGLRHHGQQGRGLERDGFAAGVGAADDELALCGGEFESERDDAAAGCAKMPFEQRMAGGFEAQKIGRDSRGHAVVVAGKAGAGLEAIDQRQDARAFDQSMSVAAHLAGERHEDAVNLGLLFFDEADQFVVLLDGFQRLHVDRLTRGADAVDHAADCAA